jgi:hypothetical protein
LRAAVSSRRDFSILFKLSRHLEIQINDFTWVRFIQERAIAAKLKVDLRKQPLPQLLFQLRCDHTSL